MAEEMNTAPVEGMEQNYLDTIQEMKRTMIGRDKYDALVAENAKLLDAVVNGQAIETAPQEQPKLRTPDEVYQDFIVSDKPRNDIERAKLWIEYRESCKAAGEPDPYVSNRKKPSAAELESVDNTQRVLEHCIEYSGGNEEIFSTELKRLLIDTNPYA